MFVRAALGLALVVGPVLGYAPASGPLALRAQAEPSVSRRALVVGAGGSALAGLVTTLFPQEAEAVKAQTGLSSVFTGQYDDPNHLGCAREIKVTGSSLGVDGRRSRKAQAIVTGTDGNPACTEGVEQKSWRLVGTVEDKDTILIDFTPKGGPKDLKGKWDGDGIKFPDGNKWTKKEYVEAPKKFKGAYVSENVAPAQAAPEAAAPPAQ